MAKHYEEELNEMETLDNTNGSNKNPLPNVPSALSWLNTAANYYKTHGFWGMLKGLFFILVACAGISIIVMTTTFITNPDKIFNYYYEWQQTKIKIEEQKHLELIEKRMENTPKIQGECDKLLWKSGGQRVLFLEMHNNTGNISGLPFYYADSSCESMADNIHPISEYCKQVKLSLMPFATELFKTGEWHGSMEELKKIDKAFYYKMMASGADHLAAVVVEGTDKPVGMLFVCYGEEDVHDCNEAIIMTKQSAMKIAVLVEVNKNKNKI